MPSNATQLTFSFFQSPHALDNLDSWLNLAGGDEG